MPSNLLPVEQYRGSWVSPKVPDYGAELVKTVNAYINAERAMARAAGGGRGGAGGLKVTGYGTVTDPTTGAQTQVPLHGTKEERKAELDRLQQNAVNATLANSLQGQAVGDISKMSVEKGEKTLNELQTTMVNELAKNAPSLRQNFQQSVQGALAPLREDISQRKKAIKEASSWDVLASAASSAGNYLRQMIEPDERRGIQIARERAAQEAADRQANAYLENQYRRMQEGAGVWERGGGTGSRVLNTLSGAVEMAPALGLTLGAAGAGTLAAGPAVGAAAAGAVGALTGTADLYNRLVMEHPDWTDEQLLEAAQRGAMTARLTGAATNAVLFPAGRLASRIPGVGRTISGTGTIPTVARTYAEIAPMAVGYQMGQNVAYNIATGQDTLANVMQGTGDVAMSTIPFAGAIGAGRVYLGRRARTKAEGGTETTEVTTNKVTDVNQMFQERRETAKAEKQVAEQKATQPVIDPEVRTNTVESLFDMLSRETDADNIKSTVRSLQDMEVSIDEIKRRVDGLQGENAQSVRDYVNSLAEANVSIKDLQKSATVRQQVNELLQNIGRLFTRDENGRIVSYDADAVARASELLDNIPDGATHEYVNAMLGELSRAKGRSKAFSYGKKLKKLFSLDSNSSNVVKDFLRDLRQSRAQRSVDSVNQARELGAAVDNIVEEVNARPEDVVTDGREGAARTNLADSGVDSQLEPNKPGTPEATPDGSVAEALADAGDAQEGRVSGAAKPDDSAAAQIARADETGKPVPGEGADRGPDTEPATAVTTEQGPGVGGDAAQARGREGGADDATGAGKQEPARGGDAGDGIKLNLPPVEADTLRVLARDATYSKKGSEKRQMFDDAIAREDPADAMAALRNALDNPGDADPRTLNHLQKALDKLKKDNPALAQGEELSPVPTAPVRSIAPDLIDTVGSAVNRLTSTSGRGAANVAKKLISDSQKTGTPIQDVFDALDQYRLMEGQKPAEIDKALRIMDSIHRKYKGLRSSPEQVEAMNRVCGR